MIAGDSTVSIEAQPHSLEINPFQTAVIVVDMQNDFGSEGGMFARAGIDISPIQAVVAPTARVLDMARRTGMPVVYLKMAFASDLSNAGGPEAPNRILHLKMNVGDPVTAPDGRESRILIDDTWNTDILTELTPQPGDLTVVKHRFSGFFETNLDAFLRDLGVTTLVFTGCTTSVCVESTLRDAFFRDYRCLVLADCTAEPIGHSLERSNHDASLFLIQLMFGWVSNSTAFIEALAEQATMAAV
ncbi:MAG TPA: cysteine hydrolase [Thermomicrobiales bacterium]|nr:cysteine hydrolase [Thermomicrobiales bacterium]